MTNIPTPAEQAAANQAKREKLELKQQLLSQCLAAIANYDGSACVSLTIDSKLTAVIADVEAEMKGWQLYLSLLDRGQLYLGTPDQISVVKFKERANCCPPVILKPLPPPAEKPIHRPQPKIIDVPATHCAEPPPPAEPVSCTFKVSDVEPETRTLETTEPAELFKKLLKGPVEACGAGATSLVEPYGFHALVETAHQAFGKHYGLELSPDHIWQTIVQGFARVVNQDPESFRGKFVTHEGTELIKIWRSEFVMGNPNNDWTGCFDEFSAEIRKRIGDDKHDLLQANFGTTGAIERAASNVALMDTVQSYFRYSVGTLCGIPFVTLHGNVADWQSVADKTKRLLAEFPSLDWWLRDVIAIVDQFVAARGGKVDSNFWNSLYKSKSTSGGIDITGWLLKLIPFITYYNGKVERNPLLGQPNCRPHVGGGQRRRSSWMSGEADLDGDETIRTGMLPQALSTVPFIWDYYGKDFDYQFIAGVIGYTQNAKTGALCPQMGWAVRPAPAAAAKV